MITFVASSLPNQFSYFKKLFSKYMLKILAIFLASSKTDLKVGVFLIPVTLFFISLCTCRYSKQTLNCFVNSENFIQYWSRYRYKNNRNISFSGLRSKPPPELSQISADFLYVICMTQRLRILPYSYRPTGKPLFAALQHQLVKTYYTKMSYFP